jgi:hypothetical protein
MQKIIYVTDFDDKKHTVILPNDSSMDVPLIKQKVKLQLNLHVQNFTMYQTNSGIDIENILSYEAIFE